MTSAPARCRRGTGPLGKVQRGTGTSSYRYTIYKGMSPTSPRCFRFQPGGRGQLPRFCIADLVKVPDARAVLEAAWGRWCCSRCCEPEPAAGLPGDKPAESRSGLDPMAR